MKKVLAILNTQRFSGAEKVVLNLFLNNKNIEPTIIVDDKFNKDYPKLKFIRTSYIKSLNRKNSSILNSIKYLPSMFLLNILVAKLLFKDKFDAVHINNMPLNIYISPLVFICRKVFHMKTNFIFHDHNLKSVESSLINKIQKIIVKTYDTIIGVSQKFKIKYEFVINKTKILYNGIDTEKYKFSAEQRWQIRELLNLKNKTVIGIFGSINEYKGHISLIEICEKLFKEFPDLHLLIIGKITSIDKNFLHTFEKVNKNSSDRITILNEIENISEYYSAIDILVNNTTSKIEEPFGTTILEAMSCSKIVVASNTGGTPEIITDNIDGIMFEADNNAVLEEKLRYVLNNVETFGEIVNNARLKILNKFTIESMVRNYNKILFDNNR